MEVLSGVGMLHSELTGSARGQAVGLSLCAAVCWVRVILFLQVFAAGRAAPAE